MNDCIFCRIVKGEVPASIVYQDAQTIAFMDIGQVNPGHVIVATKLHVANIYGLDEELAGAVFKTATRVAKAIKAVFNPAGLSLLQANEPAGFQSVFHFHIHILPRHAGDGVKLSWPAKNPPREELEQLAANIGSALDPAAASDG
jgi:histidine triad (HIT) family protein